MFLMESNTSGLQNLCGGIPLIDVDYLWNNSYPGFTSCFQSTILVWLPTFYLWLTSIPYVHFIVYKSQKNIYTKHNALNLAKTFCSLLLALLSLVSFLYHVTFEDDASEQATKAFILGDGLNFVTFLLSAILIQLERRRGFVTSGVLFFFWLFMLLANSIPCYIYVIEKVYEENILTFSILLMTITIIGANLVLHCFADVTNENVPCWQDCNPEVTSSFLNRILFVWVDRLIIKAFKKPLTESDVWNLHPNDASEKVNAGFEAAWKQEVQKWNYGESTSGDTTKIHYHQINEKTPLLSTSLSEKLAKNQSSGDECSRDQRVRRGSENKASLFRVLCRLYGLQLIGAWMCKLTYDLLQFLSPLLLSGLIAYIENRKTSEEYEWKGYFYALGFFVVALVMSVSFQQCFHIGMTIGMRMRSALVSAVYKKVLTMSNTTRQTWTAGEIVNLMSVDCQRMQDIVGYFWMIWSAPVEISLSLVLLWYQLGPSILVGVGLMVLLIPVNAAIAMKQRKLQVALMEHRDARMKTMNEVLSGIKVLKLYAWEKSFEKKILDIRNKELQALKQYAYLQAFSMFSYTCTPNIVMLLVFMTYIWSSPLHRLDAGRAFVSLSLFNILKYPINLLPLILSFAIQANVSIGRISKFLKSEDIDHLSVTRLEKVNNDETDVNVHNEDEDAVLIEHGVFSWTRQEIPTLKCINLHVPTGSLVAVVGPVGSGKSSLISAILGEMEKIRGKVQIKGNVAYVPQEAWIQNATVQDNILFGKSMSRDFYENVIGACALQPDLNILPGGDMTEIGEKGINLSGGQKQRVSLARAVYREADVYILDDPLSAVDSHVGKHIFHDVIGPKGLLRNKTRIFVTHGVQWLPLVDAVVVLTDGTITEMGSYEQLMGHAGPLAQFLKTHFERKQDENDEDDEDEEVQKLKDQIYERVESVTSSDGGISSDNSNKKYTNGTPLRRRAKTELKPEVANTDHNTQKTSSHHTLIKEETREEGQVSLAVFWAYIKALGVVFTMVILAMYTCTQAMGIVASIWLSKWSDDDLLSNHTLTDTMATREQNNMYLAIYGSLTAGQVVLVLAYSFFINLQQVKATGKLHANLLHRIFRGPMKFFDTTPIGRIINRFSKDVDIVDSSLPSTFTMWIHILFNTLNTLVVISYSTPIFTTVVLPIGILYYLMQRLYIPSTRQLQRIESTTLSPIFSHFTETISGAPCIRAYGYQATFVNECLTRVDKNLRFYAAKIASNRWLGTRLEFLGNIVVLAAALFAINTEDIDGGVVGLSVSYALQITLSLNMLVRETSALETHVVSVERIKEYTEIENEPAWDVDDPVTPSGWPMRGHVTMDHYATRYRPGLDLVLKEISCDIHCGEKVGVVGRTGAGKSSLTLALFRLIEATKGRITIDGVDISRLGLHDLRSKLTILPQDPVLFSGSLRMNLDPFNEYLEEDIWLALEHAHLKPYVSNLTSGLQHECVEGGQNLSVGQRQLVCLARALLRKSKILILDEATASVDLETDELIQKTIRQQFNQSTIITIAHRISTIMDYDRVMVLHEGKIKEFDSPSTLLANKYSSFYSLAKEANIVT